MAYRIGSFNLYKFTAYRSDAEIKKNLGVIVRIINDANYDIVALQEVFSDTAVAGLKNELRGKWEYRWEQSSEDGEGYAFLWNCATMELSYTNKVVNDGDISKEEKHIAEPHIFKQYRVDRSRGEHELIRNPYYGRFKPKGLPCEIRLINTHIRFGKGKIEDSIGAVKLRYDEFKILTEVIFPTINQRRYGNNMPAYTIMLGDYNMNLDREWTRSPYIPNETVKIVSSKERELRNVKVSNVQEIVTKQDQLTTLKNTNEIGNNAMQNDNVLADNKYANNYDHFTYDEVVFKGTWVRCRRIKVVEKYYSSAKNPYDTYKREVSDHLPIIMTFSLNGK